MSKSLKDRLKETMGIRKVKVPALSAQTGIPKDRIYAWYRDGSMPKAEDQEKLEKWLSGKISNKENVLRETADNQYIKENKSLGQVPASELIQVLKEHNEFLRRNFEASLTGILVQGASILAHVSTSLEKDDEREAGNDIGKLQQLQLNTGRRIAEKMGAGVKKNRTADS